MKKILTSILAVAAVFAAVSCSKEETKADDSFKVEQTKFDVSAEGGSVTIDVTANIAWTAESNAEWATISPASGSGNGSVTVTVAANDDVARTAKIAFAAGTFKSTVTINQAEATVDPEPEPEPAEVKSGWAIVGSWGNSWWLSERKSMLEPDGSDWYVVKGVEFADAQEFKFFYNEEWKTAEDSEDVGGWGTEISGPGMIYANQAIPCGGGNNIIVVNGGTYDIYLAVAQDYFYVMDEGKTPTEASAYTPVVMDTTWGLIGVNDDWSNDVILEESGDYFVAKNVDFTASPKFKIRGNGSWDNDYNVGRTAKDYEVLRGANWAIGVSSTTAQKTVGDDADSGADSKDICSSAEAGTYDVYFKPGYNEDNVMTSGLVYIMEQGQEPGYINPSALTYQLSNDGEVMVWEGPLAELSWTNNEMKPNTMFNDVGIKAGGKLRFHIVPNGDWWAVQFYDGNWHSFGDATYYNFPELGGGNNVGANNDYLKDGILELELTASDALNLKTYNNWGYAFITQGEQSYLTHITYLAPAGGEEDTNMIENGDFELGVISPFTGWQSDSKREISAKGEGYESDYCLVLSHELEGKELYEAQCYVDGVTFAEGKSYDVEFMAKVASGTGILQVELQQTNDYSGNYSGGKEITTEWQKFAFTMEVTAERNRFVFDFGQVANSYYIDNIKVTPVE